MSCEQIKFVEFDEYFLIHSHSWLTDLETKKLTMAANIDEADQRNWFRGLKERTDYKIWGVCFNHIPIGACGLKDIIDTHQGEYWGYIGEKKYWGKGIGKYLIEFIEEYAKKKLLKRIYLYVGSDNIRAQKLYLKKGFLIREEKENIYLMEKLYD